MKRLISVILTVSLLLSVIVVPAGAAESKPVVTAKDVLYDTASVTQWNAYFSGTLFGDLANSYKWSMLNDPIKVAGVGSLASLSSLESARSRFLAKHRSICKNPIYVIGNLLVDGHIVNPIIAYDESLGVYRLKDSRSGLWLVSNSGSFPYYAPVVTDTTTGTTTPDPDLGGKWVLSSKVKWTKVNVLSEYNLYTIGSQLKSATPDNDIGTYDDKYYYIGGKWADDSSGDHYVYCDSSSRPYVARIEEKEWSQNNTNNYYTEEGDTYEGDTIYNTGDTIENQLIDNSTNTVWFPDGTLNYIDELIYDTSTKTYYVDAHEEYDLTNNTYVTNNYKYEYHINYTSVTYIGQTAEYDEVYEFYYELPDGRSSADLTAEELQVLNTQIDVLPYIRSADDTSIRALYHFDGDCLDSSYWSHLGSLTWNKGASITYMDAGAFNGALYLDENEHDFSVTLPSILGTKDFTVQWRYYQSSTLNAAVDSSFSIGSTVLLQFDGSSILDSAGNVLSPVSVGNWQEIALVRKSGVISVFLNGVSIGSISNALSMDKTLRFVFGSDQQTYKYFDELRVVNKALYDTAYTPTSVPFDTNLALVLPDSQLPVADEYWNIESSGTNLLSEYGLSDLTSLVVDDSSYVKIFNKTPVVKNAAGTEWSYNNTTSNPPPISAFPYFALNSGLTSYSVDNGLSLVSNTFVSNLNSTPHVLPLFSVPKFSGLGTGYSTLAPTYGLMTCLRSGMTWHLPAGGSYVFSIVLDTGEVISLPFTMLSKISESSTVFVDGGGYRIAVYYGYYSGTAAGWMYSLAVQPLEYDNPAPRIVYMELIEGTETDLSAEFISSVVVMDKDDLHTPSLAVRTDINISGYQLGGVRPSLPEKGLVWALVESGRITSLQIYNGQAWESVDGRIWTGSRWIPYYAYDVLLLKDMWDIVESDPTIDPIYTESGFWSWLQNAWAGMISRLDRIISALGGGSGDGSGDTPANPDDYPAVEDDPTTEEDDSWTLIDLAVILKDGVWVVIKGTVSTAFGGLSGLADGIGTLGNYFDAYDPDTSGGVLGIMNVGSDEFWN